MNSHLPLIAAGLAAFPLVALTGLAFDRIRHHAEPDPDPVPTGSARTREEEADPC